MLRYEKTANAIFENNEKNIKGQILFANPTFSYTLLVKFVSICHMAKRMSQEKVTDYLKRPLLSNEPIISAILKIFKVPRLVLPKV